MNHKDRMNQKLVAVAKIHTDFPEKFGIPRQSGLVPGLRGEIRFEGEFRSPDAVRGIEEFSHLWLLWGFSQAKQDRVSLTVAPPRLGGKERRGVFATRSPFRPNGIGLSCVKLEEVRFDDTGAPVLMVSGVDLLDGTPIYDIKPYLPYTDAHPEALGGFGQAHREDGIEVIFQEELKSQLPASLRQVVYEVLAQDPRAAYNKQPGYLYGMRFGSYDIRFVAEGETLTVKEVVNVGGEDWERVK